jgi:hypothetical protein
MESLLRGEYLDEFIEELIKMDKQAALDELLE